MVEFLRHNTPVFICFLVILVLAQINPLIAGAVMSVWMLVWALQEKNDYLIILFSIILIVGDSRLYVFAPLKILRNIGVSILFLKSMLDILRGRYRFNRAIFLSFPFFFVAFLGVGLSPTPPIAFSKTLSYLFVLCICFNYLPYHFHRKNYRLIHHFLYLSILAYILGFAFIGINFDWAYLDGRFRGFFGNPNGLGIFSAIIIPFGFIILHKFPQKKRAAYLLIGFAFFSIILSNSRTAFGTASLFFFLYFIYKGGKIRRNFFWFFLLPLMVFILSVIPLEKLVGLVGLGEFLRVDSLTTGTGRFLAWGLAFNEIANNFWIGRGFGYEEYFFFQLRDFLITTEHQGGMHNSYLTFLMNNGMLGLIPFIIFLVSLFRRIPIKRFGFPFFIIILVSANFETWLNSSLNAFTFFFYMILAFLINYYKVKPAR